MECVPPFVSANYNKKYNIMKKLLSLFCLLTVAASMFAQTFTIDDLTYTVLSADDKTVSVSNGSSATGDVTVPETVTYNDVEYSVTTIAGGAFYGNTNITSVDMPSITTIASSAFYKCSSLISVSLPAATSIGSYAFYNCSSLTSLLLPAATSIGNYAFYKCSALTSVSLPVATSIVDEAFYGCSSISSLRIGSVEQWCNANFGDNYANPLYSSNQAVNLYIGDSETPTTTIDVPNTVTTIPALAFCKTTITSVSAPAVTSIGDHAFYGCSSLASVSLLAVDSISGSAFLSCSSVSSLRIGSVEQWCNANFGDNCASPLYSVNQAVNLYIGNSETPATAIEVPNNITAIPANAFRNTTITSISAPAATSIGRYAFRECSSLDSVSFLSVDSIANNAFYKCTSLASASFPAATSIGNSAFYECSSLTSISFPAATSIGNSAFYGCSSLVSVSLLAAPSIGGNAFYKCSNISTLRIGSVEQWCNANFGDSPLSSVNQSVNLYIGDSETPATAIEVPNNITAIPANAFCNTTITSISAPAATSIGSRAFYNCSSLASVSLLAVDSIANYAFSYCTSLASASFPAATTIGNLAFYHCSNLITASLPSLTSIGMTAFRYCTSLKSFDVAESVTSLPSSAFSRTQNLESITLPSTLTEIGNQSITYCPLLKTIVCNATTPPAFVGDSDEFSYFYQVDKSACTLYVPKNSIEAYKEADIWKEFTNIVSNVIDTDISQYDDVLYATDVKTHPGGKVTVSVKMKNSVPMTGYQFNLSVPCADLSAAITTRTTARKSDNVSLSSAYQSDGTYRVVCYTTDNEAFSGDDGEVCTIAFTLPEDIAFDDYPIYITTGRLTEKGKTYYINDDIKAKLSVEDYTPGDANNDGEINVGDLSAVVGYVLDQETAENIDEYPADANEDGTVNVGDLSEIVRLILNTPANAKAMKAVKRMAASTSAMECLPVSIMPGDDALVMISLSNEMDVTGFQFDAIMPEGFSCEDVTADFTRVDNSAYLGFADVAENTTRVLCYSPSNETVTGNSGRIAVLRIHADKDTALGTYDGVISNITIANAKTCTSLHNASLSITVSDATSIGSINVDDADAKAYDLSGRAISSKHQSHSVYITNGKKVINK